jgi:hypothetical protein
MLRHHEKVLVVLRNYERLQQFKLPFRVELFRPNRKEGIYKW